MALQDFFEPFVRVIAATTDDGFGGVTVAYTDGDTIRAGLSTNASAEAQIAYQAGTKTIYTIVTETAVQLAQNDYLRRVGDGRVYRVTGNAADMTTPVTAAVRYAQVTAEVITP